MWLNQKIEELEDELKKRTKDLHKLRKWNIKLYALWWLNLVSIFSKPYLTILIISKMSA